MAGRQGGPVLDWETPVREVFAAGKYDWSSQAEPNVLVRFVRDALRWIISFLFERLGPAAPAVVEVLGYLAIAAMIVIAALAAGGMIRRSGRGRRGGGAGAEGIEPRDAAWYRRRADALAAGGRFGEAVQAEFMALVLALDGQGVLSFHPAKTPAEYAAEAADRGIDQAGFRALVRLLYGYRFAGWPCGIDEFESWRSRAKAIGHVPAT